MEHTAVFAPSTTRARLDQVLANLTLAACAALFAYKVFLVWRININWDEFWYLNFVYALKRGELTLVLQGAYTHLFTWLPGVAGTEVDQIVAARLLMLALLGLTTWLTWKLSRRWLDGYAALVPPFTYLSLMPVIQHGGSFRADSMLAPLLMGCLVLLAGSRPSRRRELLAGVLLGIAAAITVKVLLFAPLIMLFVAFSSRGRDRASPEPVRAPTLRSIVRIGVAAGCCAVALIALHAMSIRGAAASASGAVPAESIAQFASRTAGKAFIDSGLFALIGILKSYLVWQPLPWLLIAFGSLAAAYKRQFDLAALSLALLPIAIYRNTFPYFYVVMMAPASVLAGFATASIAGYLSKASSRHVRGAFLMAVWAGLSYQGFAYVGRLALDLQLAQRQTIAGVHEIFPQPANYIDRCGMISSFRKVNFFMSTWGLQAYHDAGQPTMSALVREYRPAFILENVYALSPRARGKYALLPEDRDWLASHYPRYWGPVRVAGGSVSVEQGASARLTVPFPGQYRLVTSEPVLVDGALRRTGDVLEVDSEGVEVAAAETSQPDTRVIAKLFLAAARTPPPVIPAGPIFTGL